MEVKVDSERLMRFLQATGPEIAKAQVATAHRLAQRYLGFHRARQMHGGAGVKATKQGWLQAVKPEGGIRQKAFGYDLVGKGENLTVKMGIVSYIAKALEEGTLKRARSDLMAVPFSGMSKAALRKARALLKQSRHVKQAADMGFQLRQRRGKRSSNLKSLFIVRSRSGKEFWAERLPNAPSGWGQKRIRILFHRQKQVKMKPRLKFFATLPAFLPTARQILATGIKYALAAAQKKVGGAVRRAA
jgi:hypothetical protein